MIWLMSPFLSNSFPHSAPLCCRMDWGHLDLVFSLTQKVHLKSGISFLLRDECPTSWPEQYMYTHTHTVFDAGCKLFQVCSDKILSVTVSNGSCCNRSSGGRSTAATVHRLSRQTVLCCCCSLSGLLWGWDLALSLQTQTCLFQNVLQIPVLGKGKGNSERVKDWTLKYGEQVSYFHRRLLVYEFHPYNEKQIL